MPAISMDRQILAALKAKLSELTWAKSVNYESPKLLFSDFRDHEIPGIQFYDGGQLITHEGPRVKCDWDIIIELVLKKKSSMTVNQLELMDYKHDIELKIGANVNLGIPGVIHAKYSNSVTDLHSVDGFYTATLTFSVMFYKDFTGTCG